MAFGHLLFNRHVVLLCVLCWFLVYRLGHVLYPLSDYSLGTCLVLWKVATGHLFLYQAYGFVLCSVLVSGSSVGACLAIFEELIVGGMSCTFEGGLRPPSFLIDMWFCFVFCVGFLFINRGMSCITLSLPRGFALCSVLVSCSAVGTCLVFFVSLVVEGMSCTLEGGLRPLSFSISMWFCFVFCVGFLFITWGRSCIL